MDFEKLRERYEEDERRRAARAGDTAPRYEGVEDGLLSYAADRLARRAMLACAIAFAVAITVAVGLAPMMVYYMFASPPAFAGALVGVLACAIAGAFVLRHVVGKAVDEREDILGELERRASAREAAGSAVTIPPTTLACYTDPAAGAGSDEPLDLTDAEFDAVRSLSYDAAEMDGERTAFVGDPETGVYVPVDSPAGQGVVRDAVEDAAGAGMDEERLAAITAGLAREVLEWKDETDGDSAEDGEEAGL